MAGVGGRSDGGGGSGGGGGSPVALDGAVTCAEQAYTPKVVPVDLLILFDMSVSMDLFAGSRTKWQLASQAMNTFVTDPKSAEMGVGLTFFGLARWPRKSCATDSECGPPTFAWCSGPMRCLNPNVPVAEQRDCNPGWDCLGTGTCTVAGRCALTKEPCGPIGQPCPGTQLNNTCGVAPKVCNDLAGEDSCEAIDYETPTVEIGPLPGNEVALRAAINVRWPRTGTPTRPAAEGALNYLRAHAMKHPDRRPVLLLVTDGVPSTIGCPMNKVDDVTSVIASARLATPSITTYGIGIFDDADAAEGYAALSAWAMAGGVSKPFVVSATDRLVKEVLDALQEIRGATLGCQFAVPAAVANIDFQRVNLRVETVAGKQDLLYVGSIADCDPVRGGWYYDVDPTAGAVPTRINVCATSCSNYKADPKAKVNILYGCKTLVVP